MNPNNYATWEASKKLVDAGILLETDAGWYKIFRPGCHSFDMVLSLRSGNEKFYGDNFPAPSMAEVWRELPYAATIYKGPRYNSAWIEHGMDNTEIYKNNPTDAMIDLLIWARKEAEHET